MKILSRAEELILLAILQMGDDAYGISLRDFIREATGVEWSLAQIYDPLRRLTNKGYVNKFKGKPSPERGGRHKCLYEVTKEGKEALRELQSMQRRMWDRLSEKTLR